MQSTAKLSEFAGHLRDLIRATRNEETVWTDKLFEELAVKLFEIQRELNEPYRRLCQARLRRPQPVDWKDIPAVPASAFKDFELSCLPANERTTEFHSSGTTGHRPSRHFHSNESLGVYEDSLVAWFRRNLRLDDKVTFVGLTPPTAQAPHSSLVHMFETLRREFGYGSSVFLGEISEDGGWLLDREAAVKALRRGVEMDKPMLILGTAFSYVHLLDYLIDLDIDFKLSAGSRVMETGGYKGRSRSLSKHEFHQLICERLGILRSDIVCEYGMSELSSQAYGRVSGVEGRGDNFFHFPPWARVQIISPETGREVSEGETGLIRIFDLANVFSVMAIQTEDIGVRREDGFELVGRASLADARGCSLMTV